VNPANGNFCRYQLGNLNYATSFSEGYIEKADLTEISQLLQG
jgi:hypothetical protein